MHLFFGVYLTNATQRVVSRYHHVVGVGYSLVKSGASIAQEIRQPRIPTRLRCRGRLTLVILVGAAKTGFRPVRLNLCRRSRSPGVGLASKEM
jgi:hypothetical protein